MCLYVDAKATEKVKKAKWATKKYWKQVRPDKLKNVLRPPVANTRPHYIVGEQVAMGKVPVAKLKRLLEGDAWGTLAVGGFHVYATKKGAQRQSGYGEVLIPVTVKHEDFIVASAPDSVAEDRSQHLMFKKITIDKKDYDAALKHK